MKEQARNSQDQINKEEISNLPEREFIILIVKMFQVGRSQDGGGIGRGDHFLSYKFIERTTER